jgi:hypothetical protein
MKYEFSYLKKDGQYFPVVTVCLSWKGRGIRLEALVDSGASFSVFRPEVARYLGIRLEDGERVYLTGVGGRILGYVHEVLIKVGEETFVCKIAFSPEFTVSFNLLGRDNFFLPFKITFIEKDRKVIVGDGE